MKNNQNSRAGMQTNRFEGIVDRDLWTRRLLLPRSLLLKYSDYLKLHLINFAFSLAAFE